jgi:uncharacterized protein with von Willebrand factor type A (vWA) domain
MNPHGIESDLYDRAAIARLRSGSVAWRELDADGSRLVPHFPALLDDLFCALFKYNVIPLPPERIAPSAALAQSVLQAVLRGPAYPALRLHTLLDEAKAGLATVLVGERLLRALREERVLTSGDLIDLWSLGEREERAEEAERADALARELGEQERQGAPRGRPTKGDRALRDAAQALHDAAHGARAEREQKRRQVAANLERVGRRLGERVLHAAVDAASKVADLPNATAAWGTGLGAGGPRSAAESIDLGRRLADNPKLKKLGAMFGRIREQALAVQRRVFERASDEVYEISRSRGLEDIARLVPHELVALAHPILRRDFQRRAIDGGLATYALRGDDRHGHGPLVVCLDVSSSMAGEKELWAKAVTLTFAELARRRRRRCLVICFSSGDVALREFDLNPRASYEVALARALDLAEHFPGGGTDFMAPLEAAMAKLASRDWKRSDIVLITDGECQVTPEFTAEFARARRRLNFALYAILIDVASSRNDTVRQLADRVALVSDLTADTRDLFTSTPRRAA